MAVGNPTRPPIPKQPIPMVVSGQVLTSDDKPVSGAVVTILNSKGENLGNPATKADLSSITGADGNYSIIYGFNNVATGTTLVVKYKDAKDKEVEQKFPLDSEEGKQDLKVEMSESWLKQNKLVVIIGGVALLGLAITLIALKRRKSGKK